MQYVFLWASGRQTQGPPRAAHTLATTLPTVTSCYHVHADAHLSVALLYLGVTGAETSLLLTAYYIE